MPGSIARAPVGIRIALAAARSLPPRAAQRIIATAAPRLASRHESGLARACRVNRYVVSGERVVGAALDTAVAENIAVMIRILYDFYRVQGDRDAEIAMVNRDERFHAFLEQARNDGPFVYAGAHLGNFDLVGTVLGHHGWHMQLLSVAEPTATYRWQNAVRDRAGFETTPVTIESMKQAARRLDNGESVLTGADRPLPEPDKVQPVFFGRPAPLPLLHVRMAMRARVPVVMLTGRLEPDGSYSVLYSDPIPMEGDRPTPEALKANAEACLVPVERWITEHPEQWTMPHPVWPDVIVPDKEQ